MIFATNCSEAAQSNSVQVSEYYNLVQHADGISKLDLLLRQNRCPQQKRLSAMKHGLALFTENRAHTIDSRD